MDEGQPPLDPAVLEAVRWSAGWLSQMQGAFVDGLRADIATLIPDLGMDERTFCQRMVHAVLWAALTDDPPYVVAHSLRWVGTMNRLDGFPEAQYVTVAHSLVRVVHDLAGMHWSTSMGSAWISYFMWISPYLLDGAQQTAAQQSAERAPAWQAAQGPPAGQVDLGPLDDEDTGYGQIMVPMTRSPRHDKHPH